MISSKKWIRSITFSCFSFSCFGLNGTILRSLISLAWVRKCTVLSHFFSSFYKKHTSLVLTFSEMVLFSIILFALRIKYVRILRLIGLWKIPTSLGALLIYVSSYEKFMIFNNDSYTDECEHRGALEICFNSRTLGLPWKLFLRSHTYVWAMDLLKEKRDELFYEWIKACGQSWWRSTLLGTIYQLWVLVFSSLQCFPNGSGCHKANRKSTGRWY